MCARTRSAYAPLQRIEMAAKEGQDYYHESDRSTNMHVAYLRGSYTLLLPIPNNCSRNGPFRRSIAQTPFILYVILACSRIML